MSSVGSTFSGCPSRSGSAPRSIDLTYQVPHAAAGAARALDDMLDETDGDCRRGDLLLTLAMPPDELRFRHWYIDEFVCQIGGRRLRRGPITPEPPEATVAV